MAHHQARAFRFIELDSGCFIPISHKPNQDGYIYKTWAIDGVKVKEAFHRYVFRAHHGLDAIPGGHEIDHICQNRACANVRHLRLIERSDHKRVTNMMRYADRNERARLHWEAHRHSRTVDGRELATLFGVTRDTAWRWVRTWAAENTAMAA